MGERGDGVLTDLRTMSGGVFAGATIAYQAETLKPGTPASATVGMSGTSGDRFAVVTPSPRSLPAWISGSST